jgi:hypothetical protein
MPQAVVTRTRGNPVFSKIGGRQNLTVNVALTEWVSPPRKSVP